MLKGAIDSIHPQRIGGWIYSDLKNLRGTEVLAFVDDNCVGSGQADIFRQDLADAGLGDGHLGFSFPVSLNNNSDCSRILVRISDSDFILTPTGAQVRLPGRFDHYALQPYGSSSIEFMRKSGWLGNADLSFLKFVFDLGVFDLSLIRPKSDQSRSGLGAIDPKDLASEHLNLVALRADNISEIELVSPTALDVRSAILNSGSKPYPLVALHSDGSAMLEIVEGSHKDETDLNSMAGFVEHPLGHDKLLFVNLLCKFAIKSSKGTKLSVFFLGSQSSG